MQHSYFRDSAIRKNNGDTPGSDAGRQCAYNHSRQRFLSADVEAGDFTAASLDARLPALSGDTGEGLWLMPFRGIAPTSVRVPVDLLYLDQECRVIEAVESFPIGRVSSSSRPSTSVLVLSAGTIRSTETQSGDRLILCPPSEMKLRLEKLATLGAEAAEQEAKEAQARASNGRLLQWEDRSRARNAADDRLQEQASSATEIQPAPSNAAIEPAQPEVRNNKPAKTWLQRLLAIEPPDSRKAPRETLPGLSAYFFTGGTPVAHGVRDISLTGMYVLTSERWYIGTMVRITLTDRAEPTAERSITLNATVARWGNDGVGLRFIVQSGKASREQQADGMYNATNIADLEQFLRKLRTTAL